MCGEQASIAAFCKSLIGSPPRVRGTEEVHAKVDTYNRITPACAGNSALQNAACNL